VDRAVGIGGEGGARQQARGRATLIGTARLASLNDRSNTLDASSVKTPIISLRFQIKAVYEAF
jgi:hypothetical protein